MRHARPAVTVPHQVDSSAYAVYIGINYRITPAATPVGHERARLQLTDTPARTPEREAFIIMLMLASSCECESGELGWHQILMSKMAVKPAPQRQDSGGATPEAREPLRKRCVKILTRYVLRKTYFGASGRRDSPGALAAPLRLPAPRPRGAPGDPHRLPTGCTFPARHREHTVVNEPLQLSEEATANTT